MNETQKEMRANSEGLARRQEMVNKAFHEGALEKKKIDEEAKAKKEAVDARIRAIGNDETWHDGNQSTGRDVNENRNVNPNQSTNENRNVTGDVHGNTVNPPTKPSPSKPAAEVKHA